MEVFRGYVVNYSPIAEDKPTIFSCNLDEMLAIILHFLCRSKG